MAKKRKSFTPLNANVFRIVLFNRRICHTACVHGNGMRLTGYLTEPDGIDGNHRLKIIQRTFQHVVLPLSRKNKKKTSLGFHYCECACVCVTAYTLRTVY